MSLEIACDLGIEITGLTGIFSQGYFFLIKHFVNIPVIPAKVAICKYRQGTVFFNTHRLAI